MTDTPAQLAEKVLAELRPLAGFTVGDVSPLAELVRQAERVEELEAALKDLLRR